MLKEYGYEYNAIIDDNILSRVGWAGTDKKLWGAYSLRSGRDALKVIAREHRNSTVFLPSLCCDSMITPFESFGCKIVYYSLDSNLKVDFTSLQNSLRQIKTEKLLLFYNYFAVEMFWENHLIELKKNFPNLILVEDITHTLLGTKKLEPLADYTVVSLRKWTNVPDGGLLWTNRKLKDSNFKDCSDFAKQRLQAQWMRTKYFISGEEDLKTEYRQIFSSVSRLLDKDILPVKMTEYSYELFLNTNWDNIKKARSENSNILNSIVSKNENIKLIKGGLQTNNLYFPILVNNRNAIQKKLSAIGIFNTIIWPLRQEQILTCSTAKYICEHMLAVPCDQRYSKEDALYIGTELVRAVNE